MCWLSLCFTCRQSHYFIKKKKKYGDVAQVQWVQIQEGGLNYLNLQLFCFTKDDEL